MVVCVCDLDQNHTLRCLPPSKLAEALQPRPSWKQPIKLRLLGQTGYGMHREKPSQTSSLNATARGVIRSTVTPNVYKK